MSMQDIGIDEVGRGALAGPLLVVAARAHKKLPAGLKDSKLLTNKQRERLYPQILASCHIGKGWVVSEEIDTLGLTKAMRLGVGRALVQLKADAREPLIMDGNINYCPQEFSNVKTVIRADNLYPIVSAASIVAKVTRDRRMTEYAKVYPGYGFEKHVGYGTQSHLQILSERGQCTLHRLSFKPVMISE